MGCCSSGNSQYFESTAYPSRLSPSQLKTFSSYFVLRQFPQGAQIYTQGTPSGSFYIIIEGSVEVTVNQNFLVEKKPYDNLGIATLKEEKREVTAIAKTQCCVLEMTREKFEEYINQKSDAANDVLPLMGQNAVEKLANFDMFRGIKRQTLLLLSNMLRFRALRQGEVLFKKDSLGESFYIVTQGTIEVMDEKDDGKSDPVHSYNENDSFGEIALIFSLPQPNTMIAKTDCLLIELPGKSFQQFRKLVPDNIRLNVALKTLIAEHYRNYKIPFF